MGSADHSFALVNLISSTQYWMFVMKRRCMKNRGPMASSKTSRAADLFFPLEFLVSYDTNTFLRTLSKYVEKIRDFLSLFASGHLLSPLGPADHPLSLWILLSYSLDIVVTKRITCNEKFVHFQIGSYKCQYLGTLGPNRQWTYPLVTSWPSNIPYFWAYEVNRWVKSYLPDGLILSVMGS